MPKRFKQLIVFSIFSMGTLMPRCTHSFLQMVAGPVKYFKLAENYNELTIIATTIAIVWLNPFEVLICVCVCVFVCVCLCVFVCVCVCVCDYMLTLLICYTIEKGVQYSIEKRIETSDAG